MKDASGDLSRVEPLRNQCEKGFLLYGGEDDQGYDFVKMGVNWLVSALQISLLQISLISSTAD